MAAAALAVLAPTQAGQGLGSSLAFQRTDVAAAVLMLSWFAIAVAGAGVSRAALAVAAVAALAALLGEAAVAGNPMLGWPARILLFAPPAIALAVASLRLARAARASARLSTAPETPAPHVPEPARPDRVAARAQFESDAAELFGGGGRGRGGQQRARREALPPGVATDQFDDPEEFERLQMMRLRATEAGYTEQAVDLWRRIYRAFPDYYPAINSEARVLFQRGRLDEARERLRRSLEIAPDDETTLRLAARFAGRGNDWAASAGYWERLASLTDLNADAMSNYLKALVEDGRAEEARRLYHRHSETWPENGRVLAAGAFAAEMLHEYAESYELWRGAMVAEPGAFSHRRRAVRMLLKQDRFDEAAELVQSYQIDAANEPEAVALAEEVVAAAAQKGDDEGIRALGRLGAANPTAWARLIEQRLAADDLVGAEEAFQTAVAEGAGQPEVMRAGAVAAGRAGQAETALERWKSVIAHDPEDVAALGAAAQALANTGGSEAAKTFVAKGLALDPTDERLLRVKATIAAREADWTTALASWKAYGESAGLDEQVVYATAAALRGLGRLDDAEALVAHALVELGESPQLLIAHARSAEARGEREEALERWRRVTVEDPEGAAGWRGLIRMLVAGNDVTGARAALDRALAAVADVDELTSAPHVRRLLAQADDANPEPANP